MLRGVETLSRCAMLPVWQKPIKQRKTPERNYTASGCASIACIHSGFSPTEDQHSIAANFPTAIRLSRSTPACRCSSARATTGRFHETCDSYARNVDRNRWWVRIIGGGGGSRTRVRKCYWSRDYMLIPVHAPGITLGRSRPSLRTDKKRQPLA